MERGYNTCVPASQLSLSCVSIASRFPASSILLTMQARLPASLIDAPTWTQTFPSSTMKRSWKEVRRGPDVNGHVGGLSHERPSLCSYGLRMPSTKNSEAECITQGAPLKQLEYRCVTVGVDDSNALALAAVKRSRRTTKASHGEPCGKNTSRVSGDGTTNPVSRSSHPAVRSRSATVVVSTPERRSASTAASAVASRASLSSASYAARTRGSRGSNPGSMRVRLRIIEFGIEGQPPGKGGIDQNVTIVDPADYHAEGITAILLLCTC